MLTLGASLQKQRLKLYTEKSCFDYFAVLNKYMIHVPNTHAA